MLLWILIPVLAILVYRWLVLPHRYWLKRSVAQTKPVFLFGDNFGTTFRKQSSADLIQKVYNTAPNARFSGMYQFLIPTLMIKDPELIKQITVKDFDHFVNHRTFIPEDSDPLWANNLFSLRDQKWRDMRAILSPAFTGSKMKYMFSLISESGEQFIQYFLEQNEEIITLEMKDTFTRYTNDVIANAAFGIKCDSLREPNNEFYLMGKEATDFNGVWKLIRLLGYLIVPQLYKLLQVPLFAKSIGDFFKRIVDENIESRKKLNIVRPDMINLLMDAKNNSFNEKENQTTEVHNSEFKKFSERREITNLDITAQVLIFFFGGFDTVSSLMCFIAYELAINPDIQDKLIHEVDETRQNCNGKLTYDILTEMKYMDMVISETLRLWPAIVLFDRVCTKPYTIDPETPDEKPLYLEKGAVLWIPIYALHRDPKYFSDPDRFDPERFNDKNKATIRPYTYMPFGSGPRNCIGSRFALLETKTLFFYILSQFEIVPVEKSEIPLQLNRKSFSMTAENGFWFGFKRRNKCVVHNN